MPHTVSLRCPTPSRYVALHRLVVLPYTTLLLSLITKYDLA